MLGILSLLHVYDPVLVQIERREIDGVHWIVRLPFGLLELYWSRPVVRSVWRVSSAVSSALGSMREVT